MSMVQLPSGLYISREDMVAELQSLREKLEKGDATEADLRRSARFGAFQSGAVISGYMGLLRNIQRYGASEKPMGTETHLSLRRAAKDSFLDSLIINARLIQMRHVSQRVYTKGKQKGFQVQHKRDSDPTFKITPSIRRTCQEIEDKIFKPRADVHPSGFRDAIAKLVQGELVIDRKAIVVQRDRRERVLQWHCVPPDDIKPRNEVLLKYLPANLTGFQGFDARAKRHKPGEVVSALRQVNDNHLNYAAQTIWDKFKVDVSNAAYVQEVNGYVLGAWARDEIMVDVTSPSDEIDMFGYGLSNLERSIDVTSMLLYTWNYNKGQFLENYPEAFLTVSGDAVDTSGLELMKADIYAEVGPQGNSRLPVVNLGSGDAKAQLLRLRDTAKDLEMPQMLRMCAAFKCAAYRAHPELVNLNPDRGGDRPAVIANVDEAFQIDLSQEEGLGSLVESMATLFTRIFCEPVREYQDYIVVAALDEQMDEKALTDLWTGRTNAICTVDEARLALGMDTLEKATAGESNGRYINNVFFGQQQQQQQQAMQQQMAMLMGQGDAGGDNGEGASEALENNERLPQDQSQSKEQDMIQPGEQEGFTGLGGVQ